MKKTLVFYRGRAPRGEKSNWVMHEYRLDSRFSPSNLPKSTKNEWVLSRIFQKNCAGKKIHFSNLVSIGPSGLPPLTESSTFKVKPASDPDYVSCFSNPINSERIQSVVFGYQENSPTDIFPRIPLSNPIYSAQASSLQLPSSALMEDKSILRFTVDSNAYLPQQYCTHMLQWLCSSSIQLGFKTIFRTDAIYYRPSSIFCKLVRPDGNTWSSSGLLGSVLLLINCGRTLE